MLRRRPTRGLIHYGFAAAALLFYMGFLMSALNIRSSLHTAAALASPPEIRDRLCVVASYRDGCARTNHGAGRKAHLDTFLSSYRAHVAAVNPLLDYFIVVAEQTQSGYFNEGALLNQGFLHGRSRLGCTYFLFTDIDQILGSPRNTLVNWARQRGMPVHICTNMTQFNNSVPYDSFMGGAIMLTDAQFLRINGHSSMMEGWGKEDDNLASRILHAFGTVYSLPKDVGVCVGLDHARHQPLKVKSDSVTSPAIRAAQNGMNLNRLIYHYQKYYLSTKGRVMHDVQAQLAFMRLNIPYNLTLLHELGVVEPEIDGLYNVRSLSTIVDIAEKGPRYEHIVVHMHKGEPC